jgi:iron complex transport system substrate-binding protein
MDLEELSAIVVDCGYRLHVEAGPGLLETVYEVVLAKMLANRGLTVERQVPVPIRLMGMTFEEGFRADIIVEGRLLIELKSVEHLVSVHPKQVLTYLRLLELPLGILINFGAPTFKDGCKRIVNHHHHTQSSRLRLNQGSHAKPRSREEEERNGQWAATKKSLRAFAPSREAKADFPRGLTRSREAAKKKSEMANGRPPKNPFTPSREASTVFPFA